MIREEEVFYIGYLSRSRGIDGELELVFTDDAFDRGDSEYLVLKLDGILVPFFWEEYRFKNADTAILKFEDIDTNTAAKPLVGKEVYYPCGHGADDADDGGLRSLKAFTGFRVCQEGRELGVVAAVDDSTANTLLYVRTPDGGELIVPLHEDFVADCDLKRRTLSLALPDGVLDLNP